MNFQIVLKNPTQNLSIQNILKVKTLYRLYELRTDLHFLDMLIFYEFKGILIVSSAAGTFA